MKQLTLLILILFLAACSAAPDVNDEATATSPPQTLPADTPDPSGYPAPTAEVAAPEGAYPPPVPTQQVESYPAPSDVDESLRFTFEEPVTAGETTVSGNGVAGTRVKVIGVSAMGEELGRGTVGDDGAFSISLSRPAEAGELLGLQFADESARDALSDAPGTDIPMIGFILAEVAVTP